MITYWNSRNGEICDEDAEALRVLLSTMPFTKRLFLCLTSTGGNGLASLRIANLLRKHCESLVVLVPTCAASAATMIALAADEIWLAPHANLSPVDTKIHPCPCTGKPDKRPGRRWTGRIDPYCCAMAKRVKRKSFKSIRRPLAIYPPTRCWRCRSRQFLVFETVRCAYVIPYFQCCAKKENRNNVNKGISCSWLSDHAF